AGSRRMQQASPSKRYVAHLSFFLPGCSAGREALGRPESVRDRQCPSTKQSACHRGAIATTPRSSCIDETSRDTSVPLAGQAIPVGGGAGGGLGSDSMSDPSLRPDLVGDSPEFRAVLDKVRRILNRGPARRRLPPILIQGETGTGKGVLARNIWRAGARAAER